MKYYLHDSNSFQDEKISELYINFGFEGLGLYYTLLEKLALQEKPVKTVVLKKQLNIGKRLNKCWSFLEQIELIHSNNGETFSKTLLNFSEKYQIKKEKNRKRISEWREKQDNTKNVTCYESVRNTPKVKKSKVKESKYIYNKFYDLEILNSNNDENYIQFVKILFGENNLGLKLEGVLSLKSQLTFNQFKLVYSEKKKYNISLTTLLEDLENRPDHLKKYTHLQRVLLNWMKPNKK